MRPWQIERGLLGCLLAALVFVGCETAELPTQSSDSRKTAAPVAVSSSYLEAAGLLELVVVVVFYKELRAILFSRLHAAAAGIPVTTVWTIFLILTSVGLTVNFQTVGGLMIYSLLTNPAVAAFQLVKGYGKALCLASLLGLVSGMGGFLIAAAADLPTGAMIVILSSLLVAGAAAVSRLAGAWKRKLAGATPPLAP
jgi:ABC-type Mn2+/Zn2+ transport system permease subunit